MGIVTSLCVEAELKNLAEVRRFVEETAVSLSDNFEAIADIVLAMNEAITNIIVHGYQGQPGLIEVTIGHQQNTLFVRLRDQSPTFDPTRVPTPDISLPLEKRGFGGMGVHMMHDFLDELTYQTTAQGDNQLTLVKNLAQKGKRKMMNMTVEQAQGNVPVTIMKLQGELDASCYLDVVATANDLYQGGTQDLLLDLSETPFMASSGLIALHSIALIMRGKEPPGPDAGWGAFHVIADEAESGSTEAHFKLLNPQPRVNHTLDITGFKNIVQIYTDRQDAINSF